MREDAAHDRLVTNSNFRSTAVVLLRLCAPEQLEEANVHGAAARRAERTVSSAERQPR